jgi:hypothetical protein
MAGNYSSVVAALIARLIYHTADVEGRLLRGIRFEPIPTADVEGQTDLPIIRLWLPTLREGSQAARVGTGEMTLNLTISTPRLSGMVTHLELVELVMDAIETSQGGDTGAGEPSGTEVTAGPGLDGTLRRPMVMTIGGSFVRDLDLTAQVTITAIPHPFYRGHRIQDLPEALP